ncbi:MAG: macro domain-containing protein [Planctomycetes bacterium]|nr:macro domain-containing protein [Planctomycetota bacterium]
MSVKVILVDINPKMIESWRTSFEENPEVDIILASMVDQQVDAWVTPTNSRGSMGGGLDAVIKRHLGAQVEKRVQAEIHRLYNGKMPVGTATCVLSGGTIPRFLISTPTMVGGREDISDTLNVALACAAAFTMVQLQNDRQPGSIQTVALPGLGAANGKTPVEICADLMWTAYNLFRERSFADFVEMRAALEEQLGDLGPTSSVPKPKKKPAASAPPQPFGAPPPSTPAPQTPSVKQADVDFDDAG